MTTGWKIEKFGRHSPTCLVLCSTVRITGDIYSHLLPGPGHAASNAAEALIPRNPDDTPTRRTTPVAPRWPCGR